ATFRTRRRLRETCFRNRVCWLIRKRKLGFGRTRKICRGTTGVQKSKGQSREAVETLNLECFRGRPLNRSIGRGHVGTTPSIVDLDPCSQLQRLQFAKGGLELGTERGQFLAGSGLR